MSLDTIEAKPEIDVSRSLYADAEIRASFHALFERLQSAARGPLRVLGVTSFRRGSGVSTVAAQLAVTAALTGRHRVLVVDAHPEAPALERIFALELAPGLLDVLRGDHPLEAALEPSSIDYLWLLPAGDSVETAPSKITFNGLLNRLTMDFSFIVVDLPPLELAEPWSRWPAIQGLLLVLDAGDPPPALPAEATARLAAAPRLLGAVLNKRLTYSSPDNHPHILRTPDCARA